MARIAYSAVGETAFQRLMGHHEAVLKGWNGLGEIFETEGLSAELKEQVRRTLAYGNCCEYCKAKGAPDANPANEKISLAVAFADMVLNNRSSISDQTFAVLSESFTPQEIVELCTYICFTTASQMFGAIMNLQADDLHATF
ncbi:carboxymuconolactone decarboxylase family protein [Paenibacillus beijingensis]|uniref:Alkylhydroperoxidase n=1 Tax=Paenibacillus beijingensis TaxID=1126833 RepID=A0A0D5NFT0_9BACL|nr:carboxymuconolactone decarboxylase family protein [Paenibacillus beijingensis]AJY74229.1 alkylhydroperoxidase [Paenibacillus beijingensis]